MSSYPLLGLSVLIDNIEGLILILGFSFILSTVVLHKCYLCILDFEL